MGNKQQQASEYGGIIIRTDKPFYFSGEVVTGNIYLNIFKEGFPGRVIELKVTGKEKCSWIEEHTETVEEADGEQTTQTYNQTHSGKKQFYQHKIQIQAFQTPGLPVGQFIFPFSFQLYSYLPGSFYEKGKDYMAKTSYRVKAEIESQSKKYKNMKHTQEFIVREPLKANIASLNGEKKVNVTTCCCETAYLWIDLDNSNCKLDIKHVNAIFTNQLLLSSNKGVTKQFTSTYATQTIKGIKAGVKAIENDRKQIQLLLHDKKKPEGINSSSNGSIIKSKYTLNVVAKLDGCTCCSIDPTVEVPIQIVAPVSQIYNEPIPQPSNWNPQVFQPQIVEFSEKTLYQKDMQQIPNYNYPPQPPPEQNQFGQMMKPMS